MVMPGTVQLSVGGRQPEENDIAVKNILSADVQMKGKVFAVE